MLLWAQLRANNQGLLKLSSGAVARSHGARASDTLVDSGSVKLLNGNQGYGMVVLLEATEEAILKARAAGVGIVGTQQTSSSTGALGLEISQQLAKWRADTTAREGSDLNL